MTNLDLSGRGLFSLFHPIMDSVESHFENAPYAQPPQFIHGSSSCSIKAMAFSGVLSCQSTLATRSACET
jgi:hypothetical protein